MNNTMSESGNQNRSSFVPDVSEVLGELRARFAAVLAAIPEPIAKGADLHRALGIDRSLSWAVFKVATTANVLRIGPAVPGPAHLRTFFRAAARRGVQAEVLDAAARAAEQFAAAVARHADDRATFDSMVGALAGSEDAALLDFQQRRAAFRAQKHILGVHAKVRLACHIVRRADVPGYDVVTLLGYIKLRQLRRDTPIVISHARFVDDAGETIAVTREPLDPEVTATHGIALVPEFCSRPLPRFRTVPGVRDGFIRGELLLDDVGNGGAVDCIAGWVGRCVALRGPDDPDDWVAFGSPVRHPCELLIHDVLVEEGALAPTPISATMYPESIDVPFTLDAGEQRRLEFPAAVVHAGRGPSALHTPEVPRHAEMTECVFKRLGWDGKRFDVYRCRIEYPILPSFVVVRVAVPEEPGVQPSSP